MGDNVTKPQHYQVGGIETIDMIRAKLGPVGFGYYCEGNTLKYLTRWRHKGGVEDLRKAAVYLDWLIVEAQLSPGAADDEWFAEPHHAEVAPMPPHIAEILALHEDDDAPESSLNFDTDIAPDPRACPAGGGCDD